MKKRLTLEEQKSVLENYYKKCVAYYCDSNEQNYHNVVEAEHECNRMGIRSSEMTRVRFDALNGVVR